MTWEQPKGENMDKVRAALTEGDFELIKAAVSQAKFAVRPTALSLDELTENWNYQPMPETWTDTVQVALFEGRITMDQYKELSAMAKFTGPEPSREAATA